MATEQPTLSQVITCLKELIAKPPTIINGSNANLAEKLQQAEQTINQLTQQNNSRGEDLATIKVIDLAGLKATLFVNEDLPAGILQKIQNCRNYQNLADNRHDLIRQEFGILSQAKSNLVSQQKKERTIY